MPPPPPKRPASATGPKSAAVAGFPRAAPVAAMKAALLAALLSIAAVPAAAAEGDPESYLDPSPESRRKRVALVGGGLEFPVVGSQGDQPHLACYLDLPRALQLGLKARFDPGMAEEDYDYLPQVGLHIRQLWLNDQDSSTVRNSEYITLVIGTYFAYDFLGEPSGAKPFLAFALGKYWMPFNNRPFGLDFCLEITRYFDGHPPHKPRNHFLTVGVSLFRAIPLGR